MTNILFRCDVSPAVGLGHLHRCLTLAAALKPGANVYFICRCENMELDPVFQGRATGWRLLPWPADGKQDLQLLDEACRQWDIDRLVVDHYRADEGYQRALLDLGRPWLLFDGRADRPLWADWVLNASPLFSPQDYEPCRRRPETRFLIGPDYAPLRPEFRHWRGKKPPVDSVSNKIVLTFGGGDDQGATLFCLEALKDLPQNFERVVVTTRFNPRLKAIEKWRNNNPRVPVKIYVDEPDIARHLAGADIALIAGGTTTYEAAVLGVPAVVIQTADNQAPNLSAWQRRGTAVSMGPLKAIDRRKVFKTVMALLNDDNRRQAMSEAGRHCVDGLGAERVADILLQKSGVVS